MNITIVPIKLLTEYKMFIKNIFLYLYIVKAIIIKEIATLYKVTFSIKSELTNPMKKAAT